MCDVCESLKSQLHNKDIPLAVKLGCVKSYRAHLRDQYTDRSLLWQLCDLSYSREGDVCVCWLDGMEQAKFQVPRSRGLRTASATCPAFICCSACFQNHSFHCLSVSILNNFKIIHFIECFNSSFQNHSLPASVLLISSMPQSQFQCPSNSFSTKDLILGQSFRNPG